MAKYKLKVYTYDGKLVETREVEGSHKHAINQADIILNNYGYAGGNNVGEVKIEEEKEKG